MTPLLMIDDDEKLVALMREYLEPHGFLLAAAHDGNDGIAAVMSEPPALVILDLMLPGIDGLEVCRRLRQSAAQRVPILMLTARGEETDRIVGLELGADDYLSKPFNARELLARIRAILRRAGEDRTKEATAEGVLHNGPLTMDASRREARLDSLLIDLTSAEFDLLFALLRNVGRVLSRDQLLQEVHGSNWAAYDRSVDVHISRIRHKIEAEPKEPRLLKTVRGVGYQLAQLGPT
jgi:DNA-binding response OmpR family regulator